MKLSSSRHNLIMEINSTGDITSYVIRKNQVHYSIEVFIVFVFNVTRPSISDYLFALWSRLTMQCNVIKFIAFSLSNSSEEIKMISRIFSCFEVRFAVWFGLHQSVMWWYFPGSGECLTSDHFVLINPRIRRFVGRKLWTVSELCCAKP